LPKPPHSGGDLKSCCAAAVHSVVTPPSAHPLVLGVCVSNPCHIGRMQPCRSARQQLTQTPPLSSLADHTTVSLKHRAAGPAATRQWLKCEDRGIYRHIALPRSVCLSERGQHGTFAEWGCTDVYPPTHILGALPFPAVAVSRPGLRSCGSQYASVLSQPEPTSLTARLARGPFSLQTNTPNQHAQPTHPANTSSQHVQHSSHANTTCARA
jgi:hypothetical protein